jgi:hypothetical protein
MPLRGFLLSLRGTGFLVLLETGSAIPKVNSKLKALNPKQIQISKFKVQNRLGHLDFGHLILFSISDLVFRTLLFGIASRSLP